MTLEKTIKKLRRLRSLTQEEVSQQLGISAQAYSKIENGDTKIDVERLYQLAGIFGMEVRDVLEWAEDSSATISRGEMLMLPQTEETQGAPHYCSLAAELRGVVLQQRQEISFLREQVKTLQEMLKKYV